jgi:hypothetical protein
MFHPASFDVMPTFPFDAWRSLVLAVLADLAHAA